MLARVVFVSLSLLLALLLFSCGCFPFFDRVVPYPLRLYSFLLTVLFFGFYVCFLCVWVL